MENFNKNNPTVGWTEDETYDFCKKENKWVKELNKNAKRKRNVGVASAANDPAFSSVDAINIAFENDIDAVFLFGRTWDPVAARG